MAVTRRKAASSDQPLPQALSVGDAKIATAGAAVNSATIPLPLPSPPLSHAGLPYSKSIADDQLFVSPLDHHVATESLEKQVRRAVQVLLEKSPEKLTSRELADAVGRQVAPNPSVLATKLNIYFRNYGRKVVTYDQGDAYVLLRRSNVDQLKRRRFVYWMEDAKSLLESYEKQQVNYSAKSVEDTPASRAPHTPPTPHTSQEPDMPSLSPNSALGSEQASFDGSEMETPPPLSPVSPPRPKYAYTPPTRNFAKSVPPVQIQPNSLFEHTDLSAQDLLNQVGADDWDWVWENDEMVDEFRHPEQTSILELEKMLDLQ